MERLTTKDEEGSFFTYLFSENVIEIEDTGERLRYKARGNLIDRLAAYEDTGLLPEDVKTLQKDNVRLHKLIDEIENLYVKK